jgi:tRNA(fMet)-specific endonuclease VapC
MTRGIELAYMLDTDTVSFAMRGLSEVVERLRSHRPAELCVSAMTLAELRQGADRKGSRKHHKDIDRIAATLFVAPFDTAAATRFGKVAAALLEQGTPIGDFDTLIAAHALSLDLVLVTNNAEHFDRVKGLRTENWV